MNRRLIYALAALVALTLLALGIALVIAMPKTAPGDAPSAVTSPLEEQAASAEAVVKAYIDAWNGKSISDMERLLTEGSLDSSAIEYDVQCVDFVELLSIRETSFASQQKRAAGVLSLLEGFDEKTCVLTDMAVFYNDKGVEIYQTDSAQRENFPFWLVKEAAGSEWQIAAQGE